MSSDVSLAFFSHANVNLLAQANRHYLPLLILSLAFELADRA